MKSERPACLSCSDTGMLLFRTKYAAHVQACPDCGRRVYLTKEDRDAERAKRLDETRKAIGFDARMAFFPSFVNLATAYPRDGIEVPKLQCPRCKSTRVLVEYGCPWNEGRVVKGELIASAHCSDCGQLGAAIQAHPLSGSMIHGAVNEALQRLAEKWARLGGDDS